MLSPNKARTVAASFDVAAKHQLLMRSCERPRDGETFPRFEFRLDGANALFAQGDARLGVIQFRSAHPL